MYSIESSIIRPQEQMIISTGIAIQLPQGYEGQVRPRSGHAFKHGITILNSPGTIDAGYRGEIKIVLFNSSPKNFKVEVGDRIAQLAIREVPRIKFSQVSKLDTSDRGAGGFGSTGK